MTKKIKRDNLISKITQETLENEAFLKNYVEIQIQIKAFNTYSIKY